MTSAREHPAVLRVVQALHTAGVDTPVTVLEESARTAADAAPVLSTHTGETVDVAHIANSLVFDAAFGTLTGATSASDHSEPLLVLASGIGLVDLDLVAAAVGASQVRRAKPDQVREITGFTIGGVAPVGSLQPLRAVLDEDLAAYPRIWAAAGHHHTVFSTTFAELRRLTGATVAKVR